MKTTVKGIGLAALLMAGQSTYAAGGFGLTAKVGTLGYGIEGTTGLADNVNLRFGYNGLSGDLFRDYDYTMNGTTATFSAKASLETVSLLADWHAFGGAFRFSGGLMYDNNKFEGSAPLGYYNIGSGASTYYVGLDATVEGSRNVAPYFGVGWGNGVSKDRHWILSADLGVLFQGTPKVTLTPTGSGAALVSPNDIAIEESNLEDELKSYKFYPVASIGATYHF
jgi:hypothetical protein